jgi:hypothetical protein
MFTVVMPKRVEKQIQKLRLLEKKKLVQLIEDLREFGPILHRWKNYCKIGEAEYHCHLSYHWVACWRETDKELVLDVYYVGSRENAPY